MDLLSYVFFELILFKMIKQNNDPDFQRPNFLLFAYLMVFLKCETAEAIT